MSTEIETECKLDFTTALVWLVPECNQLQQIQTIRQQHDHAYTKWPSHITIWAPFVPLTMFNSIELQLKSSKATSTTLVLDRVGYFTQGKGQISVHLKASDEKPMRALFGKIQDALFNVPQIYTTFCPHLTLAQCKLDEFPVMEKLIRETIQLPLTCTINSLDMLSRTEHEPFQSITTIHFS